MHDWTDLFPNAQLRSRVCLELSEQKIVGVPSALQQKVAYVRKLGMQIAIDDVDFGRTCLENLILLEPDIIKIDRIFVSGVHQSKASARQLQRLLQLAITLGAKIVVEGIESNGELDVCRAMHRSIYG